jgi:tRNA(Ile)-lysidine synthase
LAVRKLVGFRMSRSEQAIAADEAKRAFALLTQFDLVLLAVSGGPDSLALLVLAAEWAKRSKLATPESVPELVVVTVDHDLREASAREAEFVAGVAAASGFRHVTLKWDGEKPLIGIPNAARNARYKLLEAHAVSLSHGRSAAVVTAHHQDDQSETVFMRLARGGGVDALAAMATDRAISHGSPVRLVRPLLEFSKAQLIATLAARDVRWIDDPTNTDETFERARVRRLLEASGLRASALAQTARRMKDARDGLDYATRHFKQTLAISFNNGVYARFDRAAFAAGPRVLRQRLLTEMITVFGGATAAPEASEIESLTVRLDASAEIGATLGGAMISAGPRYMRVWREVGRLAMADVALTPGQRQIWDGRFWISFEGGGGARVSAAPLGQARYEVLASGLPAPLQVPAAAAHGLPAFFADGVLVGVPSLGVAMKVGPALLGLKLVCDPIALNPTN